MQIQKRRCDDAGFTGLEGAIILIAFVIVASVFSFIILNSGFFATDTAQKVIYAGVEQSASSMMLAGDVYGYRAPGRDAVDMLRFTVGQSVGGGRAVDLSGCTITYMTSEKILAIQPNSTLISGTPPLPGMWTIADVSSAGDSYLIQSDEQATIVIRLQESDAALAGEKITITLIPPVGTAVTVIRTIPAKIDEVTILV
ncbi:flagellin [Methanogenium marinum]|uniref:Flagellin n=1 Tax=Methanogenium marinum TaxID=348610 RepID=A0A9Q4KUK3_9EURY|nr:archaellin/type IV pilin N-terminal domain-containing protein [Methanogenium marinum]MDE4908603.1 flagellin [Methanogenium marinum]